MSKVLHIDNKEELVKVLNENKLVLVDFFATWCRPCQMLGPVLDELSQEVDYTIVKVDVDKAPELAAEHGVRSIPTLVVYKDGIVKTTDLGVKSKVELNAMIDAQR